MVENTPAISLIPTPSAECGRPSTEIIDESRVWREERVDGRSLLSWPEPRCLPSSLAFLLLSLFLLLEKKDEAMLLVLGSNGGPCSSRRCWRCNVDADYGYNRYEGWWVGRGMVAVVNSSTVLGAVVAVVDGVVVNRSRCVVG